MKPIETPSDQRDVDVLRRLVFGRATCRAYLRQQVPRNEHRMVCGISFGYADPAHPANSYRTDRAAVDDDVGRGRERDGRGDDFMAGADAQRLEREVQCRRARIYRHAMFRADVLGQLLFEAFRLRPCRDPARAKGVQNLALLLLTD